VNNLTAYAVATGEVFMKSDGSAWRPLVHVEDMARAFISALEADREKIHRQVFNVGRNGDCMRIRELASIVGSAIPGARIKFAQSHSADVRTYRVDCKKIERIGFDPRRNVLEAVREMAQAFREANVSIEEFEGPRFVRLATIRHLRESGRLDVNLRGTVAA
jgi:nucleoside-diphosphate-sugar epimerase